MVEENAPPMRFTPDDILGLGRRRKRNRRAAAVASAATALAVAVVAVAPNALGGGDDLAPAAGGPAMLTVAGPFQGTIVTTEAAGFTISETAQVTDGYQLATITTPQDTARAAGLVALFRPGVFSAKAYTEGGQKVDVDGRPGWYVPEVRFADEPDPGPALVWEYAENAYALVAAYHRTGRGAGVPEPDPSDTTTIYPEPPKAGPPWMDKAQLTTVAAAVRTTDTAEPLRVGVKLPELPSGWSLDSAGTLSSTYGLLDDDSHLRLVQGSHTYQDVDQLRTPAGLASIVISAGPYRASEANLEIAPGEVRCPKVDWCVWLNADRTWLAAITATAADGSVNNAGTGITQATLKAMLSSATIADPADRSSWFPVRAGK
ncbi:hypothetical protein [Actinoplanes sp. M2I2]|uniref:hypothetical protein n=1 Tax=Actinoplanes sp. M2I2 TaxID=1734444 RepID=UPI002020938B|nr:hypothetical protein [Actinoplanes sp. M2I2]